MEAGSVAGAAALEALLQEQTRLCLMPHSEAYFTISAAAGAAAAAARAAAGGAAAAAATTIATDMAWTLQ